MSVADYLSAALNPVSAISNVISSKNTNETNYKIWQEQKNNMREMANQEYGFNYRLFKEQNDWNLAQWQRENEYNSPSAQVARLKAAGINPAYADGISSGESAKGVSSATPAPYSFPNVPSAPAMVNPFEGMSESVRSMLDYLTNVRKIKQEEKRISNETRMTDSQIKQADANIKLINANAANVNKLTPVQYKEVVQRISTMKTDQKKSKVDTEYRNAELRIIKAQERYLKQMPEQQYNLLLKQIAALQNENQFNAWIRKRSMEDGLSPVANSALDAIGRHLWRAFKSGVKGANSLSPSRTEKSLSTSWKRLVNSSNLTEVLINAFGIAFGE